MDFSPESIKLAQALSDELEIPAEFVCSNLYELPGFLEGEFDIVFTSYGVLHGLPDLKRWGEIIAHFLKPGGNFYIVEDHPSFRNFREKPGAEIRAERGYFHSEKPQRIEWTHSYATECEGSKGVSYVWDFSMSDVLNSLIEAGLVIDFLYAFPFAARAKFSFMEQREDGWWYLPEPFDRTIPILFSLQARKPH